MVKSDRLKSETPGDNAVHICVDMQRMLAEETEWRMPWFDRVLPNIVAITALHPERTIFTGSFRRGRRGEVSVPGAATTSAGVR